MITVEFLKDVLLVAKNCVPQGDPLPFPDDWKYYLFLTDKFSPVSFLYTKIQDDYHGEFQTILVVCLCSAQCFSYRREWALVPRIHGCNTS